MKNRLLVLALGLCSLLTSAQSSNSFYHNIDKAQEAAVDGKSILMVFAGSDWCKPCIQFKKEILMNEGFQKYAHDKLVVLYLDFPAKKKNKLSKEQTAHNEKLAEQYNRGGSFPKIVLMDANRKIKGELAFRNQGHEMFIEECNKLLQ